MTRTIAAILLAATTAIAAALPAHAGGVLLCNEYGCRSSPYFPPPIIAAFPPVVYMPPNSPVRPPPPPYVGPPGLPAPIYAPPVAAPRPPATLGRTVIRSPASPPRASPQATAEENEIEGDILAFCRDHADERFCGKLTDYLAKRGRAPQ
jgi:hypothetical protein